MEQLLEDYKRRLIGVLELISDNTDNGSVVDIRRSERLRTKASEYRTFISELERAIKENETNVKQLQEENERLREALQEFVSISYSNQPFDVKTDRMVNVLSIANKILTIK